MPRFAANITFMFPELPFMARFEAAAAAGFRAVEYLFPYAYDPHEIRRELDRLGLEQALFNAPPGDWDSGERGLAALPGREGEFQSTFETTLRFAEIVRPRVVHVMAGVLEGHAAKNAYLSNLAYAAARAAERMPDLTLTIEPINKRDMPGYFLSATGQAMEVLDAVNAPNLKLQLDLYHCQIAEGDLSRRIQSLAPRIAHVQIAGVPDRNEPHFGEVYFPHLFECLDEVGYDGWVGAEYRPRGRTSEGLAWFAPYAQP